jgi:heterodisulfide reductase subunit D
MTESISMSELFDIAKKTHAWACYDCGKCTATCPIPRAGGKYSPRKQVLETIQDHKEELLSNNGTLYMCLTCSLCDSRCPAGVGFTKLVQSLREIGYKEGIEPECPHGGALHSAMRMMAQGGTQQDRLGWLTPDLKTDPKKGDVFYWTGCTMYYDAFFTDFGVKTLEGTKAGIRLLNKLGVTPIVSPDERCCGHDLLWNGDKANFEKLAKHNVQLVLDSGAQVLVTPCAECLRTWKIDYAPYYAGKPLKIMHITEYLAERKKELKFKDGGAQKVTYQDPCRMGRHLGIYDPPRDLMNSMPHLELVEMLHHGRSATCCAGGPWSSCDKYAKKIQIGRLREARGTGAEVMVTACPKCQVHFLCAMKDPNLKDQLEIKMRDITEILADALA